MRAVEHHAALPFGETSAFIDLLRKQEGSAARALEFDRSQDRGSHRCAVKRDRSGRAALDRPGQPHGSGPRTPGPAQSRGDRRPRWHANGGRPGSSTGTGIVFAGGRAGRPLSNMALSMLLRRMGRGELTEHGFRSTFRDWAGERTSFARDLAEMALAHIVGDKVEAAYRRGDGLCKRRQMNEAWGAFCGVHQLVTGEIVALRQAAQ